MADPKIIKRIVTHNAFIKAKRVIESCNDLNQLQVASRFAEQTALKIKNDIMSIGTTEDLTVTFTAIRAHDIALSHLDEGIQKIEKKLNEKYGNQ